MIDIRELRYGSWVEYSDGFGKTHVKVVQIYEDSVVHEWQGGGAEADLENISPIPLNEEVLLKCGFEFKNNAYFSPAFNIGQRIRIVGGNDNFHFIMNIHKSIKIKSLHQLQNLIFLVTEGKELEYGK